MAIMTVVQFPSVNGAGEALDKIRSLHKLRLIALMDAAIVTWPVGKKSPKTKQLVSLTGLGALQGSFWGMLFGLIFFVPFFGLAFGAAMSALSGAFADYGIDDGFIEKNREKITEGSSALFLLTNEAVVDKVADEMKGLEFEIITANLSQAQEDALRAALGEEE